MKNLLAAGTRQCLAMALRCGLRCSPGIVEEVDALIDRAVHGGSLLVVLQVTNMRPAQRDERNLFTGLAQQSSAASRPWLPVK
jgi:hypothetical protein